MHSMNRLARIVVVALTASFVLAGCNGKEEPTRKKKDDSSKSSGGDAGKSGGAATGTAKVKGKVVFKGEAAKPGTISITGDKHCEKFHEGKSPVQEDEAIVVNEDGTLQHVVVYVESDELAKGDYDVAEPVVLDQKGCKYVPHTFAKYTGQKLEITNSDDTMHNVHFYGQQNEGFNETQQKGQLIEKAIDVQEIGARFKCDKHGWMGAWMLVLPHPFFGETRDKGTYEFAHMLPPGKYTFVAWHEKLGTTKKEFEVKAGDNEIVIEFTK